MRRRTFVAGLGSAVAWPVVTRAQQRRVRAIGYLSNQIETFRPVRCGRVPEWTR
jgi:hypothetical protein